MKLPETWFEETLALMKCSPEEIANLSRVGKAKKQIDEYTNFIRTIQLDASQHGFEIGKRWAAVKANNYNTDLVTLRCNEEAACYYVRARNDTAKEILSDKTNFTEAEEQLK